MLTSKMNIQRAIQNLKDIIEEGRYKEICIKLSAESENAIIEATVETEHLHKNAKAGVLVKNAKSVFSVLADPKVQMTETEKAFTQLEQQFVQIAKCEQAIVDEYGLETLKKMSLDVVNHLLDDTIVKSMESVKKKDNKNGLHVVN